MTRIDEGKTLPILILILLSIIWGSSFILIKKGLDSFSPLQVGTLRVVFAAAILLPLAFKNLKVVFKEHWKLIFLFGLISNLIPGVLFALAETGLSSSLTGVLNSVTPIFTMLIGALVFNSLFNKGQIIGLIIGFAGSVTISFVGSEGGIGTFNYFALFVIFSAMLYGLTSNMVKVYFFNIHPAVLTSLALFSVAPFALTYIIFSDFTQILSNSTGGWESLFYIFILGAVGTAFALIFFNKLIQITSPVFASSVTYLIPIIAVFWGIIDGETLYPLHFLGMILIMSGVYFVNKFKG